MEASQLNKKVAFVMHYNHNIDNVSLTLGKCLHAANKGLVDFLLLP